MSRKYGWTPRVRRSMEGPISMIDRKNEQKGGKNELPGKPSCKKRGGIVVYHSSGKSFADIYRENMKRIKEVFG